MTNPVLSVIDSLKGGGAQRHLLNLCKILKDTRVPSDVLSLHPKDAIYSNDFQDAGIQLNFAGRGRYDLPRIIYRLYRTLVDGNYQILHLYSQTSTAIGAILGRMCGIKYILCTISERKDQIIDSPFDFANYARLKPWIDLYLTPLPSELIKIGIPKSKIRYAPFSVDGLIGEKKITKNQNQMIKLFELENAFPILLSVGKLHPEKGHEYPIRALRHVVSQFPTCKLIILGLGHHKSYLERIVKNLNLQNHVFFGGFYKDLSGFFSASDIYINSSLHEGINLSHLQAMSFGIPSVKFDVKNSETKLIEQKAVKTVPFGNSSALAEAIVNVITNQGLYHRLGKASKDYARQYYNFNGADIYIKVYEELLSKKIKSVRY